MRNLSLQQVMSPPRAVSPAKDEPLEDDEDEWEDASDGEEELEEPAPCQQFPKQQRTPRHKADTVEPHYPQQSPEGSKPLSPFFPLDHQPVSDWGEEMELLSPRSSMGGESPLKPPSVETSPEQKKGPEGLPEAPAESLAEEPTEAPAEGLAEVQRRSEGQGISGAQADPEPADEESRATEVDPHASVAEEPSPGGVEQSQATPSCPAEEEQNQDAAETPSSD